MLRGRFWYSAWVRQTVQETQAVSTAGSLDVTPPHVVLLNNYEVFLRRTRIHFLADYIWVGTEHLQQIVD